MADIELVPGLLDSILVLMLILKCIVSRWVLNRRIIGTFLFTTFGHVVFRFR